MMTRCVRAKGTHGRHAHAAVIFISRQHKLAACAQHAKIIYKTYRAGQTVFMRFFYRLVRPILNMEYSTIIVIILLLSSLR